MNAPRYYLDTSVLSFAFATELPERQEATQAFFDLVRGGHVEAYISDVVLRELSRAPRSRRLEIEDLIREIRPAFLEADAVAVILARRYVAEGIFPRRHEDDALHVAVASTNGVDCVISWNYRHIVRPTTRRRVNAVNLLLGYSGIEIATPQEVL
ncbi:MAG: PIN domain-containing protein [candidate division NC10 bacterium]|nr:PIN domain-containing protein [candidate division NC10 bacterium]MBI2562876.1 PIN domain-containing protein [candidate division NC10 bacterium]